MWTVEFRPVKGARAGAPGPQPDGAYLTPEGERLVSPRDKATYLRTVQDWIVTPQLRTTPGVAGIDTIGGYVKEYAVRPDPARLASYGVGLNELVEAVEHANTVAGAGYISRGGEAFVVRADARVTSLVDLASAPVTNRGGLVVRVSTSPGRVRPGGAAGRRPGERRRGGDRYRPDAGRREQPDRRPGGQRAADGHRAIPGLAGGRREGGPEPHRPRRPHHPHRAEEPRRGRAAGDRRAVLPARQRARRRHHGAGHSVGLPDGRDRDEPLRRERKPNEPGSPGLRPAGRRRGRGGGGTRSPAWACAAKPRNAI